jgi:hypothetical protein
LSRLRSDIQTVPTCRNYPYHYSIDHYAVGVRGLLIYCSDYKCSHSIAITGDAWPDDIQLSDIEPRFVCKACGKRGADVRPDFHWKGPPVAALGYR